MSDDDRDSLLIRNARIVDGTGGPSQHGDVAVRDGMIAAVGKDLPAPGCRPARARSTRAARCWRRASSTCTRTSIRRSAGIAWRRRRIEHGVTTVLMGNCSLSLAPVKTRRSARAGRHVQADRGHPARAPSPPACRGRGRSYPEYLDSIRQGLGINVAGLVGHSPLRTYVMGAAAQERAATEDEIAQMCAHPAGRDPRRRRRALDLVRRHRRAHAAGAEPVGDARRDHRARPRHACGRPRPHPDRAGLLQSARAAAEHRRHGRDLARHRADVHGRADRPQRARRRCGRTRSTRSTPRRRAARASSARACRAPSTSTSASPRRSFLLYALPAWAELMRMPLAERLRRASAIRRAARICAIRRSCSAR